MKRYHKWIVVGLLVALLPMCAGCYGPFPLTRHVYRINDEVSEDKWVKSLVMWAFKIIPVYGAAVLGDVLVCNLVEFWTGKVLVEPPESANAGGATEHVTANASLRIGPGQKTATLRLYALTGEDKAVQFVRVSDTICEIQGMDGELIGKVVQSDEGGLAFYDTAGRTVARCSAQEVHSALQPGS